MEAAVHLAEADNLVESLPRGLKTQLEVPGFEGISYPGMTGGMGFGGMGGGWGYGSGSGSSDQRQGLSGGEWQRIALARAFMRANEPEVDLLVFDEPVSFLRFSLHQTCFRSPSPALLRRLDYFPDFCPNFI